MKYFDLFSVFVVLFFTTRSVSYLTQTLIIIKTRYILKYMISNTKSNMRNYNYINNYIHKDKAEYYSNISTNIFITILPYVILISYYALGYRSFHIQLLLLILILIHVILISYVIFKFNGKDLTEINYGRFDIPVKFDNLVKNILLTPVHPIIDIPIFLSMVICFILVVAVK